MPRPTTARPIRPATPGTGSPAARSQSSWSGGRDVCCWGSRWLRWLTIDAIEEHCDDQQRGRSKDAGLRADGAAGQPARPVEYRAEQTMVRSYAAVWHAVEERLPPVPSCMEPHRPPQIASAAQEETK